MKVKLKKDINIKDLAENYWEGCQSWTLDFLGKYYGKEIIFDVEEYEDGGSYKIYGTDIDTHEDIQELDYITVNKKCFETIETPKKLDESLYQTENGKNVVRTVNMLIDRIEAMEK